MLFSQYTYATEFLGYNIEGATSAMNLINDLRTNYKNISQNDAFWQEMHDSFVRSSRVVSGAVVVMIAVLIIEDWFSYRDLFPALLTAKLLSIAILASVFPFSRTHWGKRYAESIVLFYVCEERR